MHWLLVTNDYVCVDLPRTSLLSKKAFDDVIVLLWLNCHVAFHTQLLYSLVRVRSSSFKVVNKPSGETSENTKKAQY